VAYAFDLMQQREHEEEEEENELLLTAIECLKQACSSTSQEDRLFESKDYVSKQCNAMFLYALLLFEEGSWEMSEEVIKQALILDTRYQSDREGRPIVTEVLDNIYTNPTFHSFISLVCHQPNPVTSLKERQDDVFRSLQIAICAFVRERNVPYPESHTSTLLFLELGETLGKWKLLNSLQRCMTIIEDCYRHWRGNTFRTQEGEEDEAKKDTEVDFEVSNEIDHRMALLYAGKAFMEGSFQESLDFAEQAAAFSKAGSWQEHWLCGSSKLNLTFSEPSSFHEGAWWHALTEESRSTIQHAFSMAISESERESSNSNNSLPPLSVYTTLVQTMIPLPLQAVPKGTYEKAIGVLMSGIKQHPKSFTLFRYLGFLYLLNDQFTEAENALTEANLLFNGDSFTWGLLSVLTLSCGLHRLDQAQECFKQSLLAGLVEEPFHPSSNPSIKSSYEKHLVMWIFKSLEDIGSSLDAASFLANMAPYKESFVRS
jgi:tetratricopeptide (TPR) repeat protein